MRPMIALKSPIVDSFTRLGFNRATTIRKAIKNVGKVHVLLCHVCEKAETFSVSEPILIPISQLPE